jgi:hypothetical protein
LKETTNNCFQRKKTKTKKQNKQTIVFKGVVCQARAEIKQSQLTPTLCTSLSANYPSQLFSLKEKNKVGSGRKIQSKYWKSTFDKSYVN